jgi:thiol-disulfide isomerase/thioredoxin
MQGTGSISRSALVVWLAFAVTQSWATVPATAPKAPPFQPDQWVNQTEPVSASAFEGRLVLVEKWATWCGPCVASIPHLNALADKFGNKGLTIVGITSEPPEKVRPFIERKGVKYMIGSGGARGYVTAGIPHAWLVSPQGQVVWEGYPTDLKAEQIQEHLKHVTLPPRFELPRKMKDAESALNARRFGDGMQLLKEHAEGADDNLAKIARDTADQVMAYGQERLRKAEDLIKLDGYGHATEILTDLVKSFHDTEIAARARARQTALREDPRIRVELEGEELLARASELLAQNRLPQAAAFAEQITKSSKYENSKVREKARQLLASTGQTAEP